MLDFHQSDQGCGNKKVMTRLSNWIPACAGMTVVTVTPAQAGVQQKPDVANARLSVFVNHFNLFIIAVFFVIGQTGYAYL
jgi:hypothetical protein